MIRWILMIFCLAFCCSCKDSIPSNIIKPEKMQKVVWDIFRADALAQQLVQKDSSKKLPDEKAKLMNKVFSIHNINQVEFEKSYSYYTQHPDILKNILDTLNAKETRKTRVDTLPLKKPLLDTSKK